MIQINFMMRLYCVYCADASVRKFTYLKLVQSPLRKFTHILLYSDNCTIIIIISYRVVKHRLVVIFNMRQLSILTCCILCILVTAASLSVKQQCLRVRLSCSSCSNSMLRLSRSDAILSSTGSCIEVVSNASCGDDYSRASGLNKDGSKVAYKFLSCLVIALGLCCAPLLPPTNLLAAQAATGIVAGQKSALPGNTVSIAGTETKSPASKMSEEIAIEVVLSKRDAEKAKLTIVNAELSKYESDKKALNEELRVLSRKVSDLDKSILSKKDGLIRDGLVQKLAALQLESDEVALADLCLVCIRHDCRLIHCCSCRKS